MAVSEMKISVVTKLLMNISVLMTISVIATLVMPISDISDHCTVEDSFADGHVSDDDIGDG